MEVTTVSATSPEAVGADMEAGGIAVNQANYTVQVFTLKAHRLILAEQSIYSFNKSLDTKHV